MHSLCCQLCFTFAVFNDRVPIVDIGVRHSIVSHNRHSVNSWRTISSESPHESIPGINGLPSSVCVHTTPSLQSSPMPYYQTTRHLYTINNLKRTRGRNLFYCITQRRPYHASIALLIYNAPSHYTVYHYRHPTCVALQSLFASYSSKYRFRYPQPQQSSSWSY